MIEIYKQNNRFPENPYNSIDEEAKEEGKEKEVKKLKQYSSSFSTCWVVTSLSISSLPFIFMYNYSIIIFVLKVGILTNHLCLLLFYLFASKGLH